MTTPTPESQLQFVLDDVKKFGCHILHVVEEGELPPYSYSIGLNRTLKAPDVAVVGLKKDTAHALINHYRNRLVRGTRYRNGERASGYIEDAVVEFRDVHPSQLPGWFEWNVALYRTANFPMQQLVYPGTDGSWPWERQVGAWFRKRQPLLDSALKP
jgi:hypothetical protein